MGKTGGPMDMLNTITYRSALPAEAELIWTSSFGRI